MYFYITKQTLHIQKGKYSKTKGVTEPLTEGNQLQISNQNKGFQDACT